MNRAVSRESRIPELDGIRGVAIAMVLLWHFFFSVSEVTMGSGWAYFIASGRLLWSGVDLFFVLSGFLIGGILLDNRTATNYFQVFYIRRFFRIVPAYMLCISAYYILMRLIEGGVTPRLSFLSGLNTLPWAPHLLFLQNFWMAVKNSPGFTVITWSLCIEEQFYLTLPLLVRFLSPRRLLVVVCAVILGAPLLRLALTFLWPGHPWAVFVLLPCRADALMLGVVGAIAVRNDAWKTWLQNNRIALGAAIIVLAMGDLALVKFSFDHLSFGMQTVGYSVLALTYSAILLFAVTSPASLPGRFFRLVPLRRLGGLAYGLYLYHMLVVWMLYGTIYASRPIVKDIESLGLSIAAVLLTLIVAQASWYYFEGPLLQMGHRWKYQFESPVSATGELSPEPEGAG